MPLTLETYSNDELLPRIAPDVALKLAGGKFGSSLTLAKGTVLAKKTSDGKLYAYVEPNDVQTITIAGTLSGGTYRLGFTDLNGKVQWTTGIAYNANTAAIQSACDTALGASKVVVGGTAVTASTFTFSGTGYAATKQALILVDLSSLTGATNATVEHTTTLDGTETATCILTVAVATDASGNIYLGNSAVPSAINMPVPSAPVFVSGIFDTSDLTGWDAGAATDLGAKTLFTSMVRIP